VLAVSHNPAFQAVADAALPVAPPGRRGGRLVAPAPATAGGGTAKAGGGGRGGGGGAAKRARVCFAVS
jgi:hypothetical protein